ncbi:hypothetical protein WQE_07112 [Paraburkholderia hospita]|uniref:Preprotein translocase subunit SecA n=1 Tax=Paraburkholderia hospita TaxID=169430 RepID=A0ABP2PVD6_9BURK|nr:hypothetical protein [Paraburkholderia hospita]EIN01783.1 hypothetical protein WQE_07112 [Paraburkholderia hospita]OUL80496.1 hypothetical protein CA602_27895 [Paraburkholderia hospita]OUL96347.1 hypothetical protein CA601_02575 [Paraburkholderia hospita]
MLSPHEFATLMLVNDAPDQAELSGSDLEVLLGRHFVTRETLASGCQQFHLTVNGQVVLDAVTRIR